MPSVLVAIGGKSYRMACGDGEEAHLRALARRLDARVEEMRGAFGEIGDMRLAVMAALTLADEAGEAAAKLAARDAEVARLAAALDAAAARVEAVAAAMTGGAAAG